MSDSNSLKDAAGDNQPEHNSAKKSDATDANNIGSPHGDKISKFRLPNFFAGLIVAGVFATGIWILGEHFENLGYSFQAHLVNLLACIVFFAVIPFEVTKYWPHKLLIWSCFLIFIVFPLVFIFLGLKPKTEASYNRPVRAIANYPLNRLFVIAADAWQVDTYKPGTIIESIEARKGESIGRLEIISNDKAIKNLDFEISLKSDNGRYAIIYEIKQATTFPGVTCFPDTASAPRNIHVSVPGGPQIALPDAAGMPGAPQWAQHGFSSAWLIHCDEVFHHGTLIFGISSVPDLFRAGNSNWKPTRIDFSGTCDILESGIWKRVQFKDFRSL
jgi:hypothetical protein